MKFKAFTVCANKTQIGDLTTEVQAWIDEREAEGMVIVDKTVHVERQSGQASLNPAVVVTVWAATKTPLNVK